MSIIEPILEIDRPLENADWTKQTWDIPAQTPRELQRWLRMQGIPVEQFVSWPVYQLNVRKMPWLRDLEPELSAAAFDETRHPRHEKGDPRGGQWRSILEPMETAELKEVARFTDEAAAEARVILTERGEEQLTESERWDTASKQMEEMKAMTEESWAADPGLENPYYNDYYRLWADEQFVNGGDATLPDAWQKGWTWGEDAMEVDRIIMSSEPLREDVAVWRGALESIGEPSGRPLSTSFSRAVAINYADRTGRGSPQNLKRVLVPAGSHIGWDPAESEVVLPTGTTLRQVDEDLVVAEPPKEVATDAV